MILLRNIIADFRNKCIQIDLFKVSTVASQQKVPGLIPTWGLSVWSLHVLPVYAWVLSGTPASSHHPET